MWEKDIIIIMLKSNNKSKWVMIPQPPLICISQKLILYIINILSNSMPPSSIIQSFFCRIRKYFHSIIIQWIRLIQVNDIKPDRNSFPRIWNPKEKPLRVPIRIDVILQHQVILFVRHFHRGKQVARLKPRLKQHCNVLRSIQFIKWRRREIVWFVIFVFHSFEIPAVSFRILFFDKLLDIEQGRWSR